MEEKLQKAEKQMEIEEEPQIGFEEEDECWWYILKGIWDINKI